MRRSLIILLTAIAILITARAFGSNRVLSLDGDGDGVEIADNESLNIGSQVTMEAWIKPTGFPYTWIAIISKVDEESPNRSNRSYLLQLNSSGSIHLSSAPSGRGGIALRTVNGSISLNSWSHIAGVVDADSRVMRIFINGVEVARRDFGEDIRISKLPLSIGKSHQGPFNKLYFQGQMDEVRIWNIARSHEDIRRTMRRTLSGEEPGLVGYWKFDDVGDIVADSSPSHAHGKLVGDAHFVEAQLPDLGELVIPAAISGVVTDDPGKPVSNASVRLELDWEEVQRTQTDPSGNYLIAVPRPSRRLYDISATSGDLGSWESGIQLRAGEYQTLNLTLKEAISIEGTLLTLDSKTPHVRVPVQAIRNGKAVAGTLSDREGKYRFINLKPGAYQVRCQVLGGHVYYGEEKAGKPESQEARRRRNEEAMGRRNKLALSPPRSLALSSAQPTSLQVELGKTIKGIDLRFAPFKKGTWRTYTYLDGLAHNVVNDIYCDPDGALWFATRAGVCRYDGERFVTLTTRDGLAHNEVLDIYGDPDGVLWFGTRDGVSRYDGRGVTMGDFPHFINFTTEDGLADNYVTTIGRGSDGAMWFGTGWWGSPGNGASRYDGKEFVNFSVEDGLPDTTIFSIYTAGDGAIWFATGNGASRYDGKRFRNFSIGDGLASNYVTSIQGAPDGSIWFGTIDSGVSRYDGEKFHKPLTTEDGLAHDIVFDVFCDPDGVLWFMTGLYGQPGGVSRYDGKTFVNFTAQDGLGNNFPNCACRDLDGVIWFGTEHGGVSRYDNSTLLNFTIKDGLVSNWVTCVHVDSDGVMWFGTDSGVSRYDDRGVTVTVGDFPHFVNFTTEDGLAGNDVMAVHRAPDGAMWIGTYDGGASRYDGEAFVNFTQRDGLIAGNILDIQHDLDATIWVGTWGSGVFRYDGKKFVNFTTEDGPAGNVITKIYQDADGVLWFGTRDGVSRYDGKEFRNFTVSDGLIGNWVNGIYQASDGAMWFGAVGGVSRYDGKEFRNFTVEDGLAGSDVDAIYETADGVLWFGTAEGGVSRYDGENWTSLDTRDGLAGNHVRWIEEDAGGYLWFGTVDGGVSRYRPSLTPPKVRIISVRTDREYNDLKSIPRVKTGERVIISYGAIDLKTVPEKRKYRYRIRELDPDWRKAVKATEFEWTPEKPGVYTFQAQAVDRDLNYSEPASVELTVVLPFHLRAVFLVPVIGFGMAVLTTLALLATELAKRRRQVHAYQQLAVKELQDAREMQISLLPEAAPVIEGMEMAGKSITANTVGGDFLDYLPLPDGKAGIAIGDVSGKGLRAAMNAVLASGMLDEITKTQVSCGSILSTLNDGLYPRMEKQMFTAFSFAILDQDAGVIQWSNAAQPLPLIKRGSSASEVREDGELPLGMMPDVTYPDYQLALQTGDIVIFYTDGIIEAGNEAEEMYGTERLLDLVAGIDSAASAEDVIEAILQDVAEFAGSAEQYDDMTVVVAKKL